MRKLIYLGSLAALFTGFTACSPRPIGNWNVQRFEVIKQGESGLTINNEDSMELLRMRRQRLIKVDPRWMQWKP